MRFSKLFIPTVKEAPKDAVLPSHQYLIRAGFISQVGSGIYNFLPLGKIVLEKIRTVVKEELDNAGCQEVQLGFVTPGELWKESGRFEKFGKELLRFKDRKNNDFVLGPTHEEMMVDLVRGRLKSYKQLPLNIYQINTKFRDEARPRFGLLRGREFLMKDGYSFHENEEDMKREYALMEETYSKIFERLGLNFRVVEADSGAIGGSGSREFMVIADNGEDDIVVCEKCSYAANIEAAKRIKKECDTEPPEANLAKFHTPAVKTIEDLSDFFKVDPYYFVKSVAKKAVYEDGEKIVVFFLRGSDDLQETKAQNACGALELLDADDEELEKARIVPGFIGPAGLDADFYIDNELKNEKNLICGRNEKDYHTVGFAMCNFKESRYADLIEVKAEDKCLKCGENLKIVKGIEVGHIFQLGTTYSKPLNATFLDRNGKAQEFVMGTYGIGISRIEAVVIEQSHDEKGCIWTKQSAPYMLDIVISNAKDAQQKEFAENIYEKLINDGKEVIIDDRNERFGFKMNDYELIGIPYALIVGKDLKEETVEIVNRKTLKKTKCKAQDAYDKILELLS